MNPLRFSFVLPTLFSFAVISAADAESRISDVMGNILQPRLALIQTMIDRSASGDHGAVIDLQNMAEELPFVERGQRKEARKLNTQGLALLAKEQYVPAVKLLISAKNADRADAEIANNLGYAYYKAGQFAEAERALKETLAIAPARAAAWGNLGDLFASTGNQSRAIAAYRNAYRFSRAPAKTIAYFQQQQQNDTSPQVRQALATALPLLTNTTKVSNDGERNAAVGRRGLDQDPPPSQVTSAGNPYALLKAARNGNVEALKELRLLADKGDPVAQYLIGVLYERGDGVTQDPELAVSWYRRSAEQNHPAGMHALAWMASKGIGTTRNLEEALRLYRQAADKNFAPSQNNLGVAYNRGEGNAQDYEEAFRWFQRAANNSSAIGQLNLGRAYETGSGTEINFEQAFQWYFRAASHGKLATAQYKAAVAIENGRGTVKDLAQATDWYRKAAEQGVEPARDALKRLGALD